MVNGGRRPRRSQTTGSSRGTIPRMMPRYSVFSLLRNAFSYHENWQQAWQSAEPKPRYDVRSEEHTSELQSLMRISYAVFCLKKKKTERKKHIDQHEHT